MSVADPFLFSNFRVFTFIGITSLWLAIKAENFTNRFARFGFCMVRCPRHCWYW
jgi:hypothetical protein